MGTLCVRATASIGFAVLPGAQGRDGPAGPIATAGYSVSQPRSRTVHPLQKAIGCSPTDIQRETQVTKA